MNKESKPADSISNSLKCAGCGALLHFMPGTRTLQCSYCGESNEIVSGKADDVIEPVDYEDFIANIDVNRQADNVKVVDCKNCGSQTVLGASVTSDNCPFCTAPLLLNLQAGKQYLPPHYILPFEITQKQGVDFFQNWLKGLWWAPNDLAKKAGGTSATLNGVYLPYWAFDTDTTTDYTGERGDYYYTTESYTETVDGKTQTRTRQVRHTNWSYTSGSVNCRFRDLLVPSSNSLPEKTLNKLTPWKLEMLSKFDERYTSGFRSETYQLPPEQGLDKAKELTVNEISSVICEDIGGDEQRINSTDTDYRNKAIKYIMLPVWVSAYNYNNKVYQFTVNASTGEVIGERPLSAIKIVLAILLAIILILVAIFVFSQNSNP
jgi:LSD1 subclass zinc finger protein